MKKKLIPLLLVVQILSCSFNYALANSIKPDKPLDIPLTPEQKERRIQLITERVEEIRATDRSDLSRQERKLLRSELRELKKEANGIAAGGVFLTVGTDEALLPRPVLLRSNA